jgi:HlyD family secretion protein
MDDIPSDRSKDGANIKSVLGIGDEAANGAWSRWRGRVVMLVVVGVVAVAVAFWAARGPQSAVQYVTQPATKSDLTVIVTATGSVQPTNEVDVSSELSGIIREVLVDYNSPVTKGQPLAKLDTDRLEATVDSSRAHLAAAEASVLEAIATAKEKNLDFLRKKQLAERKVGSERDLEIAKAAYDRATAALASARADVSAAKADLKLQETNLAKACICSPINGVVLSRNVEPGQTVATSFQAPVLFTLAEDLREMEVQVDVDEADVGKVKVGQTAAFTVDAYPDRRFAARITELYLGSEIVQDVVTYKAVLTTDNDDLALRPGMTATAEITVEQIAGALTVPNAALRFSPPTTDPAAEESGFLQKLFPGMPKFRQPSEAVASGPQRLLWTLKDGQPHAVPVTIGSSDGRRTQVIKGAIAPGQAVIVDSTTSAK